MGKTQLFVRHDRNFNTTQRVAIKDTEFGRWDSAMLIWDEDKGFWSIDRNGKRVPTEVKTMYDLRGCHGSEYIVRILNWRIARRRKVYRIYMEVSRTEEMDQAMCPANALAVRPRLFSILESTGATKAQSNSRLRLSFYCDEPIADFLFCIDSAH